MIKRLVEDFWNYQFSTVGDKSSVEDDRLLSLTSYQPLFEAGRVTKAGEAGMLVWEEVECAATEDMIVFRGYLVQDDFPQRMKADKIPKRFIWIRYTSVVEVIRSIENCFTIVIKDEDNQYEKYRLHCNRSGDALEFYKALLQGVKEHSTIKIDAQKIEIQSFDDVQYKHSPLTNCGALTLYDRGEGRNSVLIAVDEEDMVLFHLFIHQNISHRCFTRQRKLELWVPSEETHLVLHTLVFESEEDCTLFMASIRERVAVTTAGKRGVTIIEDDAREEGNDDDNGSDEENADQDDDDGGVSEEDETDPSFLNKFVKVNKENVFAFKVSHSKKVLLKVVKNGGDKNHSASIEDKQFYHKGSHVIPEKATFLNGNRSLLVTDASDKNKLHMMDIQREKIVQTWADKSLMIESMLENKEHTHSPVVMGHTRDTLFSMDIRSPHTLEGPRLHYKQSPQFSCGAIDDSGHLLLGSEGKGDIRLYDGNANVDGFLKRAKTLIKGVGEPIRFVDVTSNGDWILATCDHFLLLYDVKSTKNQGETAFTQACASKMGPSIILKLMDNLTHVPESKAVFTKAKFDKSEMFIVAIAGSMAYLWSFRDVKNGITHIYKVYDRRESIVDMGMLEEQQEKAFIMATPRTLKSTNMNWD